MNRLPLIRDLNKIGILYSILKLITFTIQFSSKRDNFQAIRHAENSMLSAKTPKLASNVAKSLYAYQKEIFTTADMVSPQFVNSNFFDIGENHCSAFQFI